VLTIVQRGGGVRGKPSEEVRGFSSRLPWAWDGLCFAVPFNDATRDSARDLVNNAAPSEWVGSPTFGKDDRGNTIAVVPHTAYLGYPNNPAHNKPTTALTAYVRMRRASTATAATVGVFAKTHNQTDASPYNVWEIGNGDADPTMLSSSLAIGGTIYWFEDAYTTDTTTWISVFVRWQSGTAPTQSILGERGQVLSTVTHADAATGSLTYNTIDPDQPIRINSHGTTSDIYSASYSQCMVWSRKLTDTEMQALVADPYGWYSPRRSTVITSSPYVLPFGGSEMRGIGGMGGMY